MLRLTQELFDGLYTSLSSIISSINFAISCSSSFVIFTSSLDRKFHHFFWFFSFYLSYIFFLLITSAIDSFVH